LLGSTALVLLSRRRRSGPRTRRVSSAFRFADKYPSAGLFIADFLAPAIKLIVEVDGPIHARKQSADARRERKLQRAGFRIVRVSAQLVLGDLSAAVALVRAAL